MELEAPRGTGPMMDDDLTKAAARTDTMPTPPAEATDGGLLRPLPIAVLLVLAMGIGLRTMQYLGTVDMWHDELAVERIDDTGAR